MSMRPVIETQISGALIQSAPVKLNERLATAVHELIDRGESLRFAFIVLKQLQVQPLCDTLSTILMN